MASKLPNELVIEIFRNVMERSRYCNKYKNLFQLRSVCKQWNRLVPVVAKEEISKDGTRGWCIKVWTSHYHKWELFKKFRPKTITFDDKSKMIRFDFEELPRLFPTFRVAWRIINPLGVHIDSFVTLDLLKILKLKLGKEQEYQCSNRSGWNESIVCVRKNRDNKTSSFGLIEVVFINIKEEDFFGMA
ncbi:15627_t:CDS:2 [Acaulospora morrowiae]|uniref:15627_t:CDS:1 n=1 Tax=Acaulospora morrowiae TaxID=94023 RepID=A0A9N9AYC0_9GLOM|nr:15627_t:CDS:2 [Acaulospora morrowiae]